jgi:CRISPR-associated protein Cas2
MSEISEWRAVWMVVMFDLPVKTKVDKSRYRRFHSFLLDDGFSRLQYSIYGRHCASREIGETHARRIRSETPPKGEIRILRVTEAQFARMEIFRNITKTKPEQAPLPLEFW